MRRLVLSLLLLSTALIARVAFAAATSHPFTVHDMLAMDRISDPQVSPDGTRIAYVLSATDLEHNRRRSSLWLVNADGSGTRRLTTHEAGASDPRWSADGDAIWFLSSRSGSSQVWRIPVDGGEAAQVTHLDLDVNALALSPDGQRLAVAMDVFPGATIAETVKRLAETEQRVKEGPVGTPLRPSLHPPLGHLVRRASLAPVRPAGERRRRAGGRDEGDGRRLPRASRSAAPRNSPSRRDGRTVVFTARDAGRAEPWSTNFDLYAVPADGSAPPRCLTDANPAWDTGPAFSPDGRTLAYLAMKVPGYEADRFRIVLRALARRRAARAERGMGPLARNAGVVGGRQDALRGGGEPRPVLAVRHRRGHRHGRAWWSSRARCGTPCLAGERIVYADRRPQVTGRARVA